MTPANPDALVEALAQYYREEHAYLRSTATEKARRLVAGPLAPLLADLQRVTAERDEALEEAYDLKLAAAGGEDIPGSASLVTANDVRHWREKETRALRTAEARAAQLQAEVEAKDSRIALAERVKAQLEVAQNALCKIDRGGKPMRDIAAQALLDIAMVPYPEDRNALVFTAAAKEG